MPTSNMSYMSPDYSYDVKASYNGGDYAIGNTLPEKHHQYQAHVTYVTENPPQQSAQRLKRKKTGNSSLFKGELKVSHFRIPRFAAPWQHKELDFDHKAASSTIREFEPNKQWKRVLINGFIQWCIVTFICGLMVAVLFGFSSMEIMTKTHKYIFNSLITGLSIVIGMALIKALKEYVKVLSWRFLAAKYRNLQDFELIMNCDSQWTVVRLLWAGRTPKRWIPNKTQILCLLSLFVFIGLQVDIVLLGLTYSIDVNEEFVDEVPGLISVANLTTMKGDDAVTGSTLFQADTATANDYGITAQTFSVQDQSINDTSGSSGVIYRDENQKFYYRYLDYCGAANCSSSEVSSRTIYTTAECFQQQTGSFNETYVELISSDDTVSDFDYSVLPELSTTWLSADVEPSSPIWCGPRCTFVMVINKGHFDPEDSDKSVPPTVFGCANTVGQVDLHDSYSTLQQYVLPDTQARQFAGAIGWSGFNIGANNTVYQYKSYPSRSLFCWDGGNDDHFDTPEGVATLLERFTIMSIAAHDNFGPRVIMSGMSPIPALTLNVKWFWAGLVLAIIPAVQLISLICVVIWANGTVIKDWSPMSTARLLRPVVEKMDQHGCALTSDEIAEALGNYKIIYGAKKVGHGEYHVGLIEEDEGYGAKAEEGWCPGRKFPAGQYDGVGYPRDEEDNSTMDDASERDVLLGV